jgi:hypothetical protein
MDGSGGVISFSLGDAKEKTEPEFLNIYGAQESIPRHQFRQPMYVVWRAGIYDNPILTGFLAAVEFLKIPAQNFNDFSKQQTHRSELNIDV